MSEELYKLDVARFGEEKARGMWWFEDMFGEHWECTKEIFPGAQDTGLADFYRRDDAPQNDQGEDAMHQGHPEFSRHCLNCSKEFREPVIKTLIESSTLPPSGPMTVEKASDVLISPCCSAGYSLYHGSSDDEAGTISNGLSRASFDNPFTE